MIDLYYDVRLLKEEQVSKLAQVNDPMIKDKYARLYSNIINDIDLWFTSELLTRARSIASYLVDNRGFVEVIILDPPNIFPCSFPNVTNLEVELLDQQSRFFVRSLVNIPLFHLLF